MIEVLNQTWQQILVYMPKLLIAALLMVVSYYLARLVQHLIRKALRLRALDAGILNLSTESAYWIILTLGVVLGLQQFFDVATFLAGLGLLGFAVGFALQDVIKNFAAGLLLIVQGPFVVGEIIGIDAYEGTVELISLRSIAIRCTDGRLVHIPNAHALNSPMVNYTRSSKRRVQVMVGVAYDSDLEQAKAAAVQALAGMPGLQAEPALQAVFSEFQPYAVQLTVFYWVDSRAYGVAEAKDYGLRAIRRAFAEAGIHIPTMLPPATPA